MCGEKVYNDVVNSQKLELKPATHSTAYVRVVVCGHMPRKKLPAHVNERLNHSLGYDGFFYIAVTLYATFLHSRKKCVDVPRL